MDKKKLIKNRTDYISLIKAELLGPGSELSVPDSEHEIVSGSPESRYSIGILYPQGNKLNADNNEADNSSLLGNGDSVNENEGRDSIMSKKGYFADEKNDTIEEVGSDDSLDEDVNLSQQNMPSSMGITFFAKGNCDIVKCKISFATYKINLVHDCFYPAKEVDFDTFSVPAEFSSFLSYDREHKCFSLLRSVDKNEIKFLENNDFVNERYHDLISISYRLIDLLQSGYHRIPHIVEEELDFTIADYIDNNRELDGTTAKITAMRRKIDSELYSITVMLVNDAKGRQYGKNCIFQPEIKINSDNNSFVFFDYSDYLIAQSFDEEELSLAMQYRNKKVYGTGLGVSLNWDIDSSGRGCVFSDFFPVEEVPSMDFKLPKESSVEEFTLSMKSLSDLTERRKEEIIAALGDFVGTYSDWIENLKVKKRSLSDVFLPAADRNILDCEKSLSRMKEGICLLESDPVVWSAFQLSNRAMFMQRVQLSKQQALSKEDPDRFPGDKDVTEWLENTDFKSESDIHFWRPFQLAFLLMSICSISDDQCPDRNLVDLIWFPTGGGKTEAYLGLTAYTIFYRRMAHKEESSGTTVIMRYTLRLLAAQQFTRAATLICACEIIRNEGKNNSRRNRRRNTPQNDLGNDPISIGLWIGGEHTSNKNSDARENLHKLLDAKMGNLKYLKDKHNKFQILKCPWCGTKLTKEVKDNHLIGQWGYKLKNDARFYLSCPQSNCPFHAELPIQVVDEELYRNPPSLLFGTVDKFAMLPWKREIGSFFASDSADRAPELIIQDELHLISGPLGTMVGLYETVVDFLCSRKGVSPKLVASTATIRRAKEQCSALYNRNVAQFPAPGLDASDSFFAKESIISHDDGVYGRTYVGLMPSGKTKVMMEARTIAALLQKANEVNFPEDEKDILWTLTVYFNSLRDLGICSTLVDDDVRNFIRSTALRRGGLDLIRRLHHADELTSRVSTTELNETLDKLEKVGFSQENIDNKRFPSDILLATNMISVGIDIARLNSMLLVGQPKLTSEYIQASSRVGRSYPGVVFVMYDGSKSRDRSHYEQFKAYHESFYKYVEPTGATPFSKPARDRALHAIIVSALRHYIPEISNEKDAGNFERGKNLEKIDHVKHFILNRNKEIIKRLGDHLEDNTDEIESEIDMFLDDWYRYCELFDDLFYGEKFMVVRPDDDQKRLLKAYNTDRFDLTAKDTMTSMRNVDTMIPGNILIEGE